jgi:uncharacterized membrane protein YheB (UPF0754 family)
MSIETPSSYGTNYLAIQLIFRPVYPHVFCWKYLNFQGVFMKRQREVARELSAMLGKTLLKSRYMMEYVASQPGYEHLMEIHRKHTYKAVDGIVGRMKGVVIPVRGEYHYEYA